MSALDPADHWVRALVQALRDLKAARRHRTRWPRDSAMYRVALRNEEATIRRVRRLTDARRTIDGAGPAPASGKPLLWLYPC
jgi:hypothetical protein